MRRSLALVLTLLLPLAPAGGGDRDRRIAELPPEYRAWLEEVELLIGDEEIEAFLAIEKDYQRDAFIERFWRTRDTFPDTARNEFKETWDARVEEARATIGSLTEDRARILLLNGVPTARIPISCTDVWPAEVWYYQARHRLAEGVILLFYQPGGLGRYRLWHPTEGFRTLLRFPPPTFGPGGAVDDLIGSCRSEEANALLAAVRRGLRDGAMAADSVVADMLKPLPRPSSEWVSTFAAYSTELPEGARTFAAELEIDYPGRRKSRTVVRGLIAVPAAELATSELAGHRSYNLSLTGEILRDDKLFDTFRYQFNHPATAADDPPLPLVFERYLRPGGYRLVLKLEDLNANAFYAAEREIAVPAVEKLMPAEPADPETARLLAEATRAIAGGDTELKLVPPQGELLTGLLRIDTLASGDIASVAFVLDGQRLLTKKSPPFSVELDLGTMPRVRTLAAVAYDDGGEELARDEIELNGGAHRFAIRLVEPRRGRRYESSLRAEALVDVPEGKVVERVEFYLNEDLMATLYQPPWEQTILLPAGGELAYVRAVAFQPDGNATETLVFVNAPDYLEELDVQFVELYIAALDKQQRPIEGLGADDFRVVEDGVAQKPLRFDLVANLPIHAGVLVDISASMQERLATATDAALAFFRQAIGRRDRAALVTFNDHPNLATKFTNDIQDFAAGLAGIKAERGTALYDSLVFALYYFNGIKGQRALIVLTDGQDEHSRFDFDQTLEFARRAGVAIYAIGVDLGRDSGDARRKLHRLAEETGGRGFFIKDAAELPGIYDDIQRELRSRYYLAYQSTNTEVGGKFRSIEVEVARAGAEAKTLRGYYP